MFVVKAKAEIKSMNCRMEFHGDDLVPAVTVRFAAADTDAATMESAIPGIAQKLWAKGGEPQLQECYPLRVRHKIENCTAKIRIGKKVIELKGCDVNRLDIVPLHGTRCQCIFNISAQGLVNPLLHGALRSEVDIEIVERQLTLGEMEQKPAAKANGADKETKTSKAKKEPAKRGRKEKGTMRTLAEVNADAATPVH